MAILPPRTVRIQDMQERFDRLREAANESARSFRTTYTFYLIIALYILVIVSSTHHDLLFRAGNVQMPIVNVGVPVVWFFTVVPWLLLLLHFNLLIQAIFLANKVSQYAAALNGGMSRAKRSEALGLLYPAPLAHKVADADPPGSMRRLLNVIVFVTLAVLPPGILIFAQVRFLLYQEEWLTWLHRGAVVVDIGLLWWLWPRITVPHMAWREWYRTRWLKASFVLIVTAFAIVFSTFFADFPGGTMGNLTPSFNAERNDLLGRIYDLSNRVLVDTEPAPEILAAHYRATCESGNGCDELVIAVGSPFWCKHAKPLQILKDRHFRYAVLSGSTLCQADLREAKLHRANLEGAKLHGANLEGAELHGADLWGAKLHGADLSSAELHGADLWGAKLHGANLSSAELRGADLSSAELHGANLSSAELHGANLSSAELHGADLSSAKLHGAELSSAQLHGANLRGAQLHRASNDPGDSSGSFGTGMVIKRIYKLSDLSEAIFACKLILEFEAVINKRIGKPSDLSGAIFADGLTPEAVASIGKGLSDEDAKKLRERLEAHIGPPESRVFGLPKNNGASIGSYTKEEAAQWIAAYKEALSAVFGAVDASCYG